MIRPIPDRTGSTRRAAVLLAVSLLCLGQSCPGTPSDTTGDGAERHVYGDGSAGDLAVETDSSLPVVAPTGNWQFHDITIASGVIFSVPSGTTIRCTGAFTNRGSLLVSTGAVSPETGQVAHPGVSLAGAEPGQSGDSTVVVLSGVGGQGLTADQALSLLDAPIAAGGAGGTSFLQRGGAGGGGLLLLVQGAIANSGTLRADGETTILSGAGGGAGGVILLASPTSITNTGSILARGGAGGAPADSFGGGGGGSGGIVRFLGPDISAGSVDVSGGAGGTPTTGATQDTRHGGAGGGACGGNGGFGGPVINSPLNLAVKGQDGEAGQVISTLADPTAFFR